MHVDIARALGRSRAVIQELKQNAGMYVTLRCKLLAIFRRFNNANERRRLVCVPTGVRPGVRVGAPVLPVRVVHTYVALCVTCTPHRR